MSDGSGELGPVDLDAAFETFHEIYAPRIAGRVNDYDVKIAKVEGEYVWHSHPETDEYFLVLDGRLASSWRDVTPSSSAGTVRSRCHAGCGTAPSRRPAPESSCSSHAAPSTRATPIRC